MYSILLMGVVLLTVCLPVFGQSSTTTGAKNPAANDERLAGKPAASRANTQILFDDFTYSNHEQLSKNGWIVRTVDGWPGVPGARWSKDNVSFVADPETRGNRLLRMASSTGGDGSNTAQTQVCHERKYLEGTYAARVRFSDLPVSGPGGDQVVQTFYAIAPLKAPMDPDYSEMDFEYLPNGGWGKTGPNLFTTTWHTFSPEPNWKQDNASFSVGGSLNGWHTLVIQVADKKVRYLIDGKVLAEHVDRFYPRSIMSINFNQWFIKDGLAKSTEPRHYTEDIDWVFHQANSVLAPNEVEAKVADLRRRKIGFRDTVQRPVPALESPCNF